MSASQNAAQDLERVFIASATDYHGVRLYPEGYQNGWCKHCHKTYSAALKCSLKKWPNQTDGSEI